MGNGAFEESKAFNLQDLLEYQTNAIVIKDILVQNNCVIQAGVFDYGKVQSYGESPFSRFIYVLCGKAEIVINENSTFMQAGDSILVPANVRCSIEANHRFMMLSVAAGNGSSS